jgi:hypothetical protein
MPVISVLRRWRKEDCELEGQPGLQRETVSPNNKQINNQKQKPKKRRKQGRHDYASEWQRLSESQSMVPICIILYRS